MFKLHLKRIVIGAIIGAIVGFQAGWKGQEAINSNPVTKFVSTGKF